MGEISFVVVGLGFVSSICLAIHSRMSFQEKEKGKGETETFTDAIPNFVVRGFATEQECEELRKLADAAGDKQRATVGSDRRKDDSVRNNVTAYVRDRPAIRDRVDRLLVDRVGADVSMPESVQVQIYGPGEHYSAHTDSWTLKDVCEHGMKQRSWTCVLYLNDVESGGTTSFPKLGVKLSAKNDPSRAPEKGTLACWYNLDASGLEPEKLSEHKGDEVKAGEKYLANFWYNVKVDCGNSEPGLGLESGKREKEKEQGTGSSSRPSSSPFYFLAVLLVSALLFCAFLFLRSMGK